MLASPYHWAEETREKLASMLRLPAGDRIEVVLASDQNFLKYTAVTIASLLQNYRDARPLRIHLLLEAPLPDADSRKFAALSEIHPFTLNAVPVDGRQYQGIRTTPGISVATYFRLQMHDLLPADVTRVIYMDADIIVKDCVSNLFDIDLGVEAMAGVEDTISADYVSKLSQHPDTIHVNAGVLLIDVDAMRKLDLTRLVNSFMTARRYTIMLGDQEILTSIFGLVTKKAPIKWNVHGGMFEEQWVERYVGQRNSMNRKEAMAAIRTPSLIHYTFKRKPWVALDHPRAGDWRQTALNTEYKFDLGVVGRE